MLAQTRQKLRNAESSIAFMQEQHAKTLEGLHHEIQKLQHKNARLTFELAMKGPSALGSVPTGCSCCKELEEEVTSCKAEILGLRSALSTHKETVKLLQHQVEELCSRNDNATVSNDEKISGMVIELESKSNAIALLTQQLYQSKVRLQQALEVNNRMHEHLNKITSELSSHQQSTHATSSIVRRSRNPRNRTTSSPSSSSCDIDYLAEDRASIHQPIPISPRPPLTSPSSSSVRRASNPVRRDSTPSPGPRDGQHHYVRVSRSQQVSRHSSRTLDPVRSHRQTGIPQEISEILHIQSQESLDEGTAVTMKPTPPVLPPIGTDSNSTYSQSNESLLLNGLEESPGYHATARPRHILLARAQGLGSAAQSAARVLQRRAVTEDVVGRAEENRVDEATSTKGSLLVKQSVNKKTQAWQELHQKGAD